MKKEFRKIIYEKRDGVSWITLNDPDRRNALSREMRKELLQALEDSSRDNAVRVVIIRGAGPSFCGGADVRVFLEIDRNSIYRYLMEEGISARIGKLIREMPKPVIALVHGYCVGGGLEMAMFCDMIIATDDAKFGQPEVRVGLMPGGGGSQLLPRIVGEKKAKEMIFTGKFYSAKDCERFGLVNLVVDSDNLDDVINDVINRMISNSPIAIAKAKEAINASMEAALSDGLSYERRLFADLFGTEDLREGIRAFLEKRKPRWRGK